MLLHFLLLHSGAYFTSKKDRGFESEIFEFNFDGSFSYVFFTCTGIGVGKGYYDIIKGDSLQLKFTNCEKCQDYLQVETIKNAGDSLAIDLKIRSWTDDFDIPGANVYLIKQRNGTTSNLNGRARISALKPKSDQKLQISYVGYDPVELEVPANTTQIKGTVYLSDHWVYDNSDVKTFKVLKWTQSKLVLKRYPKLTIRYNKIKPNKTDPLIIHRMGEAGYKMYVEKIRKPEKKE